GGASGYAAAERLRRLGYEGELVMLSADADAPYDRPNLSKDYLAGEAPEEWIPLSDAAFYAKHRIDLRLGRAVTRLEPAERRLILDDGRKLDWDALLIATGAEPVRLKAFEGAPEAMTLRSLADCRSIIERAKTAKRALVVGAGFIGMEVAASLKA